MNLPNKITTSRLVITVAFVVVLLMDFPLNTTVACALFFIGGISDIVDGMIARRRGLVTDFGKLMDPLADKIMVCAGFVMLIGIEMPFTLEQKIPDGWMPAWAEVPGQHLLLPAWMAIIIVARELAITGLRLLAASKGVILPAEAIGKRKTNLQVGAVIAILICVSYDDWGTWGRQFFDPKISGVPWSVWVTMIGTWAAVGLTAISGGHYLWRNRALFMKDL
ncbi:MAG: CDP-diacylglycerol--glycerol-3-phosphate 3-phosphatidyltransferase [Pedosphaera sp.]|nr:CDP-diacylglycerol--glycerol-3-phosphate 3-phosphatidyltransferase [Pedosphaera sp.]